MSLFEALVLTHLMGHTLKLLIDDKRVLEFIDGCLIGSLSAYLFITLVLL